MHPKRITAVGSAAVLATFLLSGVAGPADGGFWLRVLFVACWVAAAVLVAWRGNPGVASAVAIVFLISFPVAYSGAGAGWPALEQAWRAPGWVSLVAFLYLFPRGLFEPRWTAITAGCSAAYLTARAFVPDLAAWPGDLVVFPSIAILPLFLQVVRFRSASNPVDRYQMRIVGLTSLVAMLGLLTLFGLQLSGVLGPVRAAEAFVEPASYALALLLPAGVAWAIVPLRGRARRVTDQVLASSDGTQELIDRVHTLARSSVSSRDLLKGLSDVIRRALRLPHVSIELGDHAPRVVEGGAHATPMTWPIDYRGASVGELRATPRSGGELSEEDQRILHRLAIELAPTVGAIQLAAQLDEARQRLLGIREEERRRLRADLHDELGATLAGLTLKTGLARDLIGPDPEATRRLLGEIEAGLQTSVVRIRKLIQGLRPAQLDELGLAAAIREQAEHLASGAPIAIQVHGHIDPGLPAALELAAYRIAQEAITNAVRHSGGTQVDVELAVDDNKQHLTVQVTDNGTGLDAADTLGFGVSSMRQRARELGGDCIIRQGNTRGLVVTATLPLAAGGAR